MFDFGIARYCLHSVCLSLACIVSHLVIIHAEILEQKGSMNRSVLYILRIIFIYIDFQSQIDWQITFNNYNEIARSIYLSAQVSLCKCQCNVSIIHCGNIMISNVALCIISALFSYPNIIKFALCVSVCRAKCRATVVFYWLMCARS